MKTMCDHQILFGLLLVLLLCYSAVYGSNPVPQLQQQQQVQHVVESSQNRTQTHKLHSIGDTIIVHLISSAPTTTSSQQQHQHTHHHAHKQHPHHHHHKSNSTAATDQSDNQRVNHPSVNCTDGETYWNSLTNECTNCTGDCPAGAFVSRICNRTQDLECQCHKGSYMDVAERQCKPCHECPFGWGVWRTCRWSRNTVCRKCQPGTYSGVSVGTLGCIPCTKCGPEQETISECDGNRDTVCVDRLTLRNSYPSSLTAAERHRISSIRVASSLAQNARAEEEDEQNDEDDDERVRGADSTPIYLHQSLHQFAMPFYFAVLVVVVFALCAYLLIRLKCAQVIPGRTPMNGPEQKEQLMYSNQAQHQLAGPKVIATGPVLPSYTMPSPYYAHTPHLQAYKASAHQQQQQQPFSTVMHLYTGAQTDRVAKNVTRHSSNLSCRPSTASQRHKPKIYYPAVHEPTAPTSAADEQKLSLTPEMIEALEQRLGNDSISWRMLARELGFSETRIGELETKSTNTNTASGTGATISEAVDNVKACRQLLTDWCQQSADSGQQKSTPAHGPNRSGGSWPGSVATLVKSLTRIGRVDCARLLQHQLSHNSSLPSSNGTSSTNTSCSTASSSTSATTAICQKTDEDEKDKQ